MCAATLAAAVTPHISTFIWIAGLTGGGMFCVGIGMLIQQRADTRTIATARASFEAALTRINARRVRLQTAHRSTKAVERELRAARTEQLRKELAR